MTNSNSPYILLPRHVHLEIAIKNLTITDTVSWLMYPNDEQYNEYFKTEFGKVYLTYIRFALSDFIRNSIDRNYSEFKFKRQDPKLLKSQIKAESGVISKTWKLIRLLGGHYQTTIPLPILFYALAKEHNLFFFNFIDTSREAQQKIKTVTDFRKVIQSQNKRSSEAKDIFENPFNRDKSPYTHRFMKICNFESEKNAEIQKEYNSLVKARKHLTTTIFAAHPEIIRKDNQKREMRGRKYGV